MTNGKISKPQRAVLMFLNGTERQQSGLNATFDGIRKMGLDIDRASFENQTILALERKAFIIMSTDPNGGLILSLTQRAKHNCMVHDQNQKKILSVSGAMELYEAAHLPDGAWWAMMEELTGLDARALASELADECF